MMEREDFPKTSLNTSFNFRFDTVRQFKVQFFTGNHPSELEAVSYQISQIAYISRCNIERFDYFTDAFSSVFTAFSLFPTISCTGLYR